MSQKLREKDQLLGDWQDGDRKMPIYEVNTATPGKLDKSIMRGMRKTGPYWSELRTWNGDKEVEKTLSA